MGSGMWGTEAPVQEETSEYLRLQELEEQTLQLRTFKAELTFISPNEGGEQSAVKLFQSGSLGLSSGSVWLE